MKWDRIKMRAAAVLRHELKQGDLDSVGLNRRCILRQIAQAAATEDPETVIERFVESFDIRCASALRKVVPEAFPGDYRHERLVPYMDKNDDWRIETEPQFEPNS